MRIWIFTRYAVRNLKQFWLIHIRRSQEISSFVRTGLLRESCLWGYRVAWVLLLQPSDQQWIMWLVPGSAHLWTTSLKEDQHNSTFFTGISIYIPLLSTKLLKWKKESLRYYLFDTLSWHYFFFSTKTYDDLNVKWRLETYQSVKTKTVQF